MRCNEQTLTFRGDYTAAACMYYTKKPVSLSTYVTGTVRIHFRREYIIIRAGLCTKKRARVSSARLHVPRGIGGAHVGGGVIRWWARRVHDVITSGYFGLGNRYMRGVGRGWM